MGRMGRMACSWILESPAPEVSMRLHSSALRGKSYFSADIGTQSSMLPYTLKCQGNLCPWIIIISRPQNSHCLLGWFSYACSTTLLGSWKPTPRKQAPELSLTADLALLCLQSYSTGPLEAYSQQAGPACPQAWFSCACSTTLPDSWKPTPGKQAPALPLTTGFVLPCLQQQLWLLEALAPAQVDPRTSTALGAPEDSSPLALVHHGHPQLATQCEKPAAACASEPKPPHFAILLVPGGFLPHRTWRPSTHQQALLEESPHCPIKEPEPRSSTGCNLPLCRSQKTCFPKVQKT
jgi:hypothetical protein